MGFDIRFGLFKRVNGARAASSSFSVTAITDNLAVDILYKIIGAGIDVKLLLVMYAIGPKNHSWAVNQLSSGVDDPIIIAFSAIS
jgi:hypothetical protein